MLLNLAFVPLLICALLCWLLSGRVATRVLGLFTSAGAMSALALLLTAALRTPLPVFPPSYTWASTEGLSVTVGLHGDGLALLLSCVVLLCVMVVSWSISRALAPTIVGYGLIFSGLALLAIGLLGALLAADLMLLIFGWGVALIGAAVARRASGVQSSGLSFGLTVGVSSGLALLLALLLIAADRGGSALISTLGAAPVGGLSLGALLLALALALGLPPFTWTGAEHGGPLQLHGLIAGCGLPLVASYVLLRLYSLTAFREPGWPSWFYTWLIVLGGLGFVGGAALALSTSSLRTILLAQRTALYGLALLGMGAHAEQPGGTAGVVFFPLIVIAALSTTIGGVALASLTRETGSDDLHTQRRLSRPLALAGTTYAAAALSAVGLPPLGGFWARQWLIEGGATVLLPEAETPVLAHVQPWYYDAPPWLAPLVLVGSLLLAASYIGPLSLFWRVSPQARPAEERSGGLALTLGLLLLALPGALPWMDNLLRRASLDVLPSGAIYTAPDAPLPMILIVGGVGLLGLILALLFSAAPEPPVFAGGEPQEPDQGTPLTPAALGASLRWLTALTWPNALYQLVLRALDLISGLLERLFGALGGRFYVTGVFVALIALLIVLVA